MNVVEVLSPSLRAVGTAARVLHLILDVEAVVVADVDKPLNIKGLAVASRRGGCDASCTRGVSGDARIPAPVA